MFHVVSRGARKTYSLRHPDVCRSGARAVMRSEHRYPYRRARALAELVFMIATYIAGVWVSWELWTSGLGNPALTTAGTLGWFLLTIWPVLQIIACLRSPHAIHITGNVLSINSPSMSIPCECVTYSVSEDLRQVQFFNVGFDLQETVLASIVQHGGDHDVRRMRSFIVHWRYIGNAGLAKKAVVDFFSASPSPTGS